MQENRAPNQLEGAQLVNLPNFEGLLHKKAGVYTKFFQVRGGQGPAGPPLSPPVCERTKLGSVSEHVMYFLRSKI
jgi:hypothetical protein